jgi:predicted CXXCH cytochrome family protein
MLILLGGLWIGCTPTEQNYKVLSFFFDGVPNPSDPAFRSGRASRSGGLGGAEAFVVYTHAPYADPDPNACNVCHEGRVGGVYTRSSLTIPPTVCLKCHQDEVNKYPVMHGPVAAVECLWCHAPHESSIPALLRRRAPELCLQCHTLELLAPWPPEHHQPDIDCLQCHVAHGGERHGLLRARVNPPSTAPSGGPT